MDVKPGYKMTEVGVIPEDWEVEQLGKVVCRFKLGGNYPNQEIASSYPLMKMGNMTRGSFDISKTEFVSHGIVPEEQHRLTKGDVLFNTRNTMELVGKVAMWRDELPHAYYNSNLMRLEFDERKIGSNEYVNFAFNTAGTVARLRALATGTTSVAAIYTRDLMGLLLIIPPLPEQRAIAAALSDVDALIESLEKLIAKKRDVKQATMQQLLTGATRLPGFEGEWEVKRLGEIATVKKGELITSDMAVKGSIPVIAGGKLPAYYHNAANRNGPTVTISASGANAGFVSYHSLPIFASDCSTIEEGIDFSLMYLYYQLRLRQQAIYKSQTGGAQPHVHPVDLNPIEIPMPCYEEQVKIANVLSDADSEIEALEARRDKTKLLKQGMMQELLTGKTRLV